MNIAKITLSTREELIAFDRIVRSFESNIDMVKGRYCVDAKSILGVMSIDTTEPVEVMIYTSNEDELVRFLDAMKQFAVHRKEK